MDNANNTTDERLSLDDLREQLIRQEETIIFALIERAQWAHNESIYRSGALEVPPPYSNDSFLDYFFCEIEKVHALCRRYTSPDEHPFYPAKLPGPILPLLNYKRIIKPNTINLNHKIKSLYVEKILPAICTENDDQQYGSSSNADVAVLQALSKRIHYGKFVAEAKFQQTPQDYRDLIEKRDLDGIMEKLTNKAVEEKLLERVRLKASTYGKELGEKIIESQYKLMPEIIVELYRDHIIPMTKEVQVLYLLERINGASVAYLGPEGTFSQQVAVKFFKNSTASSAETKFVPCDDIKEVFVNVLSNKTLYGIIPIENSQTGIIHPHLSLIIENDISLFAEVYLPISFCLISRSKLDSIKTIYSHQQGFQQCQKWLKAHVPSAVLVPVPSTAQGAEAALNNDDVAVLGSSMIAQKYNLPIIASNLQETKDNVTRFLVIAKSHGEPSGKDKTIITFGASHVPGALSSILSIFQSKNINLTAIESYPDKVKKFSYGFFVEFEGHVNDQRVADALTQIRKYCTFVNIKGSFPVGINE